MFILNVTWTYFFVSVFFSLFLIFFCWEGDFFLQEARFYFWQRDSFFVFIDRPQECIISIPSICNMQNIAHCLSFKKTFSSQYGLKWTQRKSDLIESKLFSHIRNSTSGTTSACSSDRVAYHMMHVSILKT